MIRLSELKLPLDHPEGELAQLAARTLGVDAAALARVHVHKRSFDARKADLLVVYICLLYTSPSPRDKRQSRMPSSA